jgi:hypothetical protein
VSGTWIRVRKNLSRAKVARRLAPLCKGGAQHAAGVLQDFWSSVSDNAKNGFIGDADDRTLEDWANWEGRRGAFAKWVRENHMDADGRVNEWDEYQEELEFVREKARDKKRRQRAQKRSRVQGDNPGDGPGTNRETVPQSPPPTERNGTERDGISSSASAARELADEPAIARLFARLPEHRHQGYLDRFAKWLEGYGLPAGVHITRAVLLDAIDEFDGGDAPDLLLRFVCRKAKTLREHASTAAATARRSMADETYDNALKGALAVQRLAQDKAS